MTTAANSAAPSGVNAINLNYLEHVMEMSKTHVVSAAEDIFDDAGTLLWAKGKRIDSRLQEKLIVRKLQRPLEVSLVVESGVTMESILALVQGIGTSNPTIFAIARKHLSAAINSFAAASLCQPACLLLTTLQNSRPHVFAHSVEVALLSASLAIQIGLPPESVEHLIIGGLLHDVGELYINPDYLDQKRSLTPSEWKHIAAHPRISQLILESLTDYPKPIARAIAEHHERFDGSGYPRGIAGNNMSRCGQILSMAEMLSGILHNRSYPIVRATLAVKLIPGEFPAELINAIGEMRRASSAPPQEAAGFAAAAVPELIQKTRVVGMALSGSINECRLIQLQANKTPQPAKDLLAQIESRLLQLQKALSAIGLGDCFTSDYLDAQSSDNYEETYLELDVVVCEISWRLRDIARDLALKLEDFDEQAQSVFLPLATSLLVSQHQAEPCRPKQEQTNAEASAPLRPSNSDDTLKVGAFSLPAQKVPLENARLH
ncbi:MAG: HD-GYP domain-containing protein [Burkholderiales bacterium]